MATLEDATGPLLRRGLLWLGAATAVGTAVELAADRHWTQPIQLVAWAALGATVAAIVLLFGAPSGRRVRLARVLAGIVSVSAVLGIWEHVAANHDAGPLDFHYTDTWDSLPVASQWWLAVTKTVGPSPPLAPGALAQASACALLATLRHPALRQRDEAA